jgi:hypothetical protein
MSGHTPGPWSVCGAQDGKCPCSSVLYKDGVICEVRDSNSDMADATGHAPSPEEAQANKRLIAAAPELLEALKIVAGSENWRCSEDGEWDIVNAAIAKAEGRS